MDQWAYLNLKPPPIIRLSTFSNNCSITAILSDTFAPPNIAVKGLTGFSTASPKNFNSFCIKYP